MKNQFRVNEEVLVYDIVGKLHKGIVQRNYHNKFGYNVYQVLLTEVMFIVEVDADRIREIEF